MDNSDEAIEERSRDAWKNVAMHLAGALGDAKEQIIVLEEALSASKVIEGVLRAQLELSRALEKKL